MLYKGYIINPDPYLLPCFKLSPFCNSDIELNKRGSEHYSCDIYFKNKHGKSKYHYTSNGRNALNCALKYFGLEKDDLVSIITTSQNFYISSCVTSEIEKFCKWNREIVPKTKVILVNHEFGFPYENLNELKVLNLPIIEDCAYSFHSQNEEQSVGTVGDFVIYSFPKFFPIQIGGLLVSRKIDFQIKDKISGETDHYLRNVLSYYIDSINNFSEIRKSNYNYLKIKIAELGILSRFGALKDEIIPGVFMFRLGENIKVQDLKEFYYNNGVECSVFYGENSFFIPCHHNLKVKDLDFFIALLEFYLNNN